MPKSERFVVRANTKNGREWWDVIDTKTGRKPAGASERERAEHLADKRNRAYVLINQAEALYAQARNILDD